MYVIGIYRTLNMVIKTVWKGK